MKKKGFVFLVVLMISLLSVVGAAAKGGWQENPDTIWVVLGGSFNVIEDGTVILWHAAELFGFGEMNMYWIADVNAPCPTKYPDFLASGWGFDLSDLLGWDDPQWQDGFAICSANYKISTKYK